MEPDVQAEAAEEQRLIDPYAMAQVRKRELPLGNTHFIFNWSRITVPEFLLAYMGVSDRSNDSTSQALRRIFLKVVEPDQKGLLLDIFNDPDNGPMPGQIAEIMLKSVTDNETKIGRIETLKEKDKRQFTVSLTTDGKTQIFTFVSNRQKYAEYEEQRDNPDINPVEAIYNFLFSCLPEERQNDFALLEYDERNFSLSTKIYRRVTDFLSQTAVTIGELKPVN